MKNTAQMSRYFFARTVQACVVAVCWCYLAVVLSFGAAVSQ